MDELSKWRAEVIERFINVEWLINAIICQHYLEKTFTNFLLEVLYDEYFSFALKRRILEKILCQIDNKDNKSKINQLNRINTIRNYFAHYNQQFFEKGDDTGKVPDPRRINRAIDFNALYEEFMSTVGGVELWLSEVFEAMGGALDEKRINGDSDQ